MDDVYGIGRSERMRNGKIESTRCACGISSFNVGCDSDVELEGQCVGCGEDNGS